MRNELLHKKNEYENVRHLVEWAAETYGENTAFSYKPQQNKPEVVKVNYLAFRDDVRGLASELLSRGYANKQCVVVAKLSYEYIVTYYAVLSIGATLVPLDREWTEKDLGDTALRADAHLLIADCDIKEKAAYIKDAAKIEPDVIYFGGEENTVASLIEEGKKKYAENSDAYHNAPIDADKMSLLVFTSGTTGKGKGVMLSQRNFLSDLSSVIPYIDFGKKTVGVLPPHHTYGSSVMFIGHVMIGCEIYISGGLRYVQKELRAEEPEHLVLVPLYLETFYRKIMANIKEKGKEKLVSRMIKVSNFLLKFGIDLRNLLFKEIRAAFGGKVKMIISGGAPINADILNFFKAIGISTLNGYGITECAPIIAVNRSRRDIPGSVGPVLDIDTVKIAEPNEDGEGEICVKGSNVMLGYYKDEAATAEAFDEEGYFKTGDYGKLVGDVIFITGRKKNLIILSNGKNVYPEEIESELIAVPGVIDIIVYEGQSRRGIEHNAIVAEIFPDKEYAEKNGIADMKAHLQPYVDAYNRTAVPYKKIGVLKVRDEEFPKNTLRKIMRFKLDMSID